MHAIKNKHNQWFKFNYHRTSNSQ